MSFVRIWVHIVFTTRNRDQIFSSDIRRKLFAHIRENCRRKDIYLDRIGGWSDHVHLLISLGREQNIAKVAMLIKGESAHWLNAQKLLRGKFHWQDDYYAISVSESQVEAVRSYIENQEEHHKARPLEHEIQTLDRIFRGQ
jgi:putative transposase